MEMADFDSWDKQFVEIDLHTKSFRVGRLAGETEWAGTTNQAKPSSRR